MCEGSQGASLEQPFHVQKTELWAGFPQQSWGWGPVVCSSFLWLEQCWHLLLCAWGVPHQRRPVPSQGGEAGVSINLLEGVLLSRLVAATSDSRAGGCVDLWHPRDTLSSDRFAGPRRGGVGSGGWLPAAYGAGSGDGIIVRTPTRALRA